MRGGGGGGGGGAPVSCGPERCRVSGFSTMLPGVEAVAGVVAAVAVGVGGGVGGGVCGTVGSDRRPCFAAASVLSTRAAGLVGCGTISPCCFCCADGGGSATGHAPAASTCSSSDDSGMTRGFEVAR